MLQHSTVVGGLIPVNDAKVEAVIEAAFTDLAEKASTDTKKVTGEDVRKLGYTDEHARFVSQRLKDAGHPVVRKVTGELKGIGYVVNRDSKGVQHHKLRVLLGEDLLSLDLSGEYAQRLAVKLEGVLADGVEGAISISAFAEIIDRNGRKFANHIAAVKSSRGEEIKAVKDHFRIVQEQVTEATAKIRSSEAKAGERKAIKVEYFAALVQDLAAQRPIPEASAAREESDPTPKPASQAPAQAREKLAALRTQFKGQVPPRAAQAQAQAPRIPARAAR
jgi:hypothetical protein